MARRDQDTNIHPGIELLAEKGFEGLSEAITILINQAMHLERSRHLQAEAYERTENRRGYANGYKSKTLNTRLGHLKLQVPQVRECDFYPSILERGIRSERALKLALAEMYVQGVSTRKVKEITEVLCGFEVSSSDVSRASAELDSELGKWRERPLSSFKYLFVDARYEKVRQSGCVVASAVLIADGIDDKGNRTILGVSVSLSESEIHWRQFFESLVTRGLHGLELIISDAHSGLKAAKNAVFPSVPWQRCQFHIQQNAQAYIPKKSMKKEVACEIRSIFNAANRQEADRLLNMIVEKYKKEVPILSNWLADNISEGLTIFNFPENHRRRLRTTNMAELTNKEVRRRTRVAGLFPNVESCLRLVSAVLVEIDEEWQQGKVYLGAGNNLD